MTQLVDFVDPVVLVSVVSCGGSPHHRQSWSWDHSRKQSLGIVGIEHDTGEVVIGVRGPKWDAAVIELNFLSFGNDW